VSAVDVRLVIRDAVAIHGGVRAVELEVARFYLRDLAPGREFFRSNVVPVLAVVSDYVNQSIIVPTHTMLLASGEGLIVYTTPNRSVIGWSISLAVIASSVEGTAGFTRERSGLIFSHVRPRSRERKTNWF